MSKRFIIFVFITGLLLTSSVAFGATLSFRLKGRILLQVEAKGEAWYVNPANEKRYYLGRPIDALAAMRELGIGISNNDLAKIAVADSGLNNPDQIFATKQSGKIFLQVEANGEAWYVNPVNIKRYYLGRPDDAFNLMRSLGLGITSRDLNQILIGSYASGQISSFFSMEKEVHDLINQERVKNSLNVLKWNDDLAAVAREHSLNLAKENIPLIKPDIKCNLPLIHHESLDLNFGLYAQDRLKNRQVYYLSADAENIALIPAISSSKYYVISQPADKVDIANCQEFFVSLDNQLKQNLANAESATEKIKIINDDISYRVGLVNKEPKIDVISTIRRSNSEVSVESVTGWMNSPGHRKNILTAEYDEAGVGIAEVNNYFILTQVFITRAKCGYETGPCCEKAGYYPYCYQPFNCTEMICD